MIKELPHDRAAFEAAKPAGELEHIRASMVSQYISHKVDSVVQYYFSFIQSYTNCTKIQLNS